MTCIEEERVRFLSDWEGDCRNLTENGSAKTSTCIQKSHKNVVFPESILCVGIPVLSDQLNCTCSLE